MIRGLVTKTIYEVWAPTLIFIVAVFVFEMLLAYILASFAADMIGPMFQNAFFQNIVKGLLGADLPANFGPPAISAMSWVHPAILMLLWSQAVTFATRTPAGEIDRGTIDVLLTLPVSRFRLLASDTLVGLTCGAVMIAAGFLGFWIGNRFLPPESRADFARLAVIAVNCYCLYMTVMGLSFLTSALNERRGRAIAAVVAIILPSFVLNFLTQFSATAESIGFLSFMTYYRPLEVLQQSGWPVADMLVLLTAAGTSWLAAAIVFIRRDIRTT